MFGYAEGHYGVDVYDGLGSGAIIMLSYPACVVMSYPARPDI